MVAVILALGVAALAAWVAVEKRVASPLVDLTALRHRAVAGANLVMFIAGVTMYLLFTLVTRFVQTPPEAGYGFGLDEVQAGLVLVPFSILGFVAGRLIPKFEDRVSPFVLLVVNGVVIAADCIVFATLREATVVWPIVAMSVLGFGVGGFSAVMPQAILAVTPSDDTAAAMSVNQVVRSVGFSIGSAVSGLILAAHITTGAFAPTGAGYTLAAWIAAALAVATIVLSAGVHATHRGHQSSAASGR